MDNIATDSTQGYRAARSEWHEQLEGAADIHQVLIVSRDYLATFGPEHLARFPADCRPGRIKGEDDIAYWSCRLAQVTGENAAIAISALLDAARAGGGSVVAAVVGAITLLLGATTVFAELQADLNRIWRQKPPKAGGALAFLRARLASFSLLMTAGALLLASVGASAWLAWMSRHWLPVTEIVLHAADFAVSFLVLTGLFAM